jgi:plasmid stabilization system protein ParE
MTFELTRTALAELADIRRFIDQDNPTAAAAVLGRLDYVMQQLAAGEVQGPEVRMANGRVLRRWSVPPYRIYYRRSTRRNVIVRVYHQARRPIE